MSCGTGIAAAIANGCDKALTGGVEVTGWILNRIDIASITYNATTPLQVDTFSLVATKKIYLFSATGIKKPFGAKSALVKNEATPDKYNQTVSFTDFSLKAADITATENIKDVIVIFEVVDKQTGGDGTFVILGLGTGLELSKADTDLITGTGTAVELMSRFPELHRYNTLKVVDYAGTKSFLTGLLA